NGLQVFCDGICISKSFDEYLQLRGCVEGHLAHQEPECPRCMMIHDPRRNVKITVHRSRVRGFWNFLHDAHKHFRLICNHSAMAPPELLGVTGRTREWAVNLN
ncbi:MAG: hypothetical protein AAGB22_08965, partial [Bacteroidota bacterium]